MHTLFDFITHIKGVEYIIAVSAILGYIIYWEVLKPRPFRSLVTSAKEDLEHVRKSGTAVRTVGRIVAAPFIGLAYVALLPLSFAAALFITALQGVARLTGGSPSFGWRPVEAYFTGKKKKDKGASGE